MGQFHHHFMSSFYTRRSQKEQKSCQGISHFGLLGSTSVKATPKHVGEIEPML
jgi:hypothetical protein